MSLTDYEKWLGDHSNQFVTLAVFVLLVVFGWVFTYVWTHALLLALFAGALGGLAHEIVQSKGEIIFPSWDKGNYCLGGLVGLIAGGTAGLLAYQGLMGNAGVIVNTKLIVTALLAGLAVKGIADAPNPGPSPDSNPAANPATNP